MTFISKSWRKVWKRKMIYSYTFWIVFKLFMLWFYLKLFICFSEWNGTFSCEFWVWILTLTIFCTTLSSGFGQGQLNEIEVFTVYSVLLWGSLCQVGRPMLMLLGVPYVPSCCQASQTHSCHISYLHRTASRSPGRGSLKSRGLFWIRVPNGWEDVVSDKSSSQLCVVATCGQIKK